MLAFWAIGAMLLAAALLFVLPPLRRNGTGGVADAGALALRVVREQAAELDAARAAGRLGAEEHAAERAALERRALDEVGETPAAAASAAAVPWAWIGALALAVPLLALALYLPLGAPGSLTAAAPAAPASGAAHALTPEQMQGMVESLAERLKREPGDGDGWHMLARSYVAFARYPEAAQAYDRAVSLLPPQPALLTDYADTLALVNGRKLDGRPIELVRAALQLDPRHPKALALAGTEAFNRQDFATAADFWQRLLATQPPGSDGAQRAAASLKQAQAGMAGAGAAVAAATGNAVAPAAATSATTAPAAGAAVTGQVTLAPALRSRLAGGETLFVFARAVNGPRMPLAIQRQPAGDMSGPSAFRLDNSQAMSPQLRLSGQVEVMLGARLSRSGNATPQSGDLMGTLGPVKVGAGALNLVIDGVVP